MSRLRYCSRCGSVDENTANATGLLNMAALGFISHTDKIPPGRSKRYASRKMSRVASCGSSWQTKHSDTRSALASARPVFSAAACTNVSGSVAPASSWTQRCQTPAGLNTAQPITACLPLLLLVLPDCQKVGREVDPSHPAARQGPQQLQATETSGTPQVDHIPHLADTELTKQLPEHLTVPPAKLLVTTGCVVDSSENDMPPHMSAPAYSGCRSLPAGSMTLACTDTAAGPTSNAASQLRFP